MGSSYTTEDCKSAVAYVVDAAGEPVTAEKYRENTEEEHPSISVLKSHFGGLSRCVYQSGFRPTRYSNPTELECEEALNSVIDSVGEIPTRSEYEAEDTVITARSIKSTAGVEEWRDALEEFGFDTTSKYGIETGSEEERQAYIEVLKEYIQRQGESVESVCYDDAREHIVNQTELGRDGFYRHWGGGKILPKNLMLIAAVFTNTKKKNLLSTFRRQRKNLVEHRVCRKLLRTLV
jgi:hypothetical protein